MYGRGFGKVAPVKEGEELDVKVEGVGEKGDGIARVDGFVLFIPGVREGDEVRVKVTKVLSKVGFAEVVGSSSGPVEESTEVIEQEPEAKLQEVESPETEPEEVPEDTTDFGEDL